MNPVVHLAEHDVRSLGLDIVIALDLSGQYAGADEPGVAGDTA